MKIWNSISGWTMWNNPVDSLEILLILSLALSPNAFADEPPEMALLEFLGEWETNDGEWLDPSELEELPELTQTEEVQDDESVQ